jgi:hypothetical protein
MSQPFVSSKSGRRLHRWAGIGVVAVAGIAAALLGLMAVGDGQGGRAGGTGTPGSTLATVPEGSKAAYLLLEKLGHQVERQAHPLKGFGRAKLAFYLAPQGRLDHADPTALGTWIENGGVLVYGVSAFDPEASAIATALGLPALVIMPRSDLHGPLPHAWAPAAKLNLHASVRVQDHDDNDDPAVHALSLAPLHDGDSREPGRGEPVALQIDRGRGHIYVLDARVFSNAGLKQADNALFLAVLAHRHADGQPIAFDEFVHGFGEMSSLLQIARWPLRWALAIGALALLCFGLASGRRLGAVSPLPHPARRASIEQIEILASFFAAKKDRGSALAALAAWTGAPAPTDAPRDDNAFVAAAAAMNQKGLRWPKA